MFKLGVELGIWKIQFHVFQVIKTDFLTSPLIETLTGLK